ncbi:PAS domain-containing protein [Streptomyces sp. NPDC051018]|uniref:PAS domain-containing protein n=1 Tax=Streptomyces sp. NPDC051018 TaxID=3365639 RepID=UPI003790211B
MSSRPSRGAARLAAILDALPDGLVLVNCNGTVVNANTIALELFETPGTALVGRGLLDLLPAFDSRLIPGSMRRQEAAEEHRRTKPARMVARRTDGSEFPVEVTSASLEDGREAYDSSNAYTGDELLMLVVRDLSGTVDTEAELARSRRQTEMILRAAAEGVVGTDTEGRVVLVNPAAAQILGFRASDLGGQELHPLILHSREDGKPFPYPESPLADTLRSGRKHRVRGQVLWAKDGSRVPVDLTTAPVRDGDQLVGAVMTFTDRRPFEKVAERHRAELDETAERFAAEFADRADRYTAEIESRDERYLELAERHRQLTAVLGESLRGPLEELRTELGTLAADPAGQLWPEANQILHHLAAGYARMTTLIDNVLGFQRLGTGTEQLYKSNALLDAIVGAGVEGAVELIGPGRAQFAVHAPPIEAEVDAGRLATALAHLIADVAGVDSTGKARPAPGGAYVDSTIVVAAAQRGEVVRIEVRGPFAGGDPVHEPIVRGIVRAHGGVLQTHEVPGMSGSAYVLEVPLGEGAGSVPPPGENPGGALALPGQASPETSGGGGRRRARRSSTDAFLESPLSPLVGEHPADPAGVANGPGAVGTPGGAGPAGMTGTAAGQGGTGRRRAVQGGPAARPGQPDRATGRPGPAGTGAQPALGGPALRGAHPGQAAQEAQAARGAHGIRGAQAIPGARGAQGAQGIQGAQAPPGGRDGRAAHELIPAQDAGGDASGTTGGGVQGGGPHGTPQDGGTMGGPHGTGRRRGRPSPAEEGVAVVPAGAPLPSEGSVVTAAEGAAPTGRAALGETVPPQGVSADAGGTGRRARHGGVPELPPALAPASVPVPATGLAPGAAPAPATGTAAVPAGRRARRALAPAPAEIPGAGPGAVSAGASTSGGAGGNGGAEPVARTAFALPPAESDRVPPTAGEADASLPGRHDAVRNLTGTDPHFTPPQPHPAPTGRRRARGVAVTGPGGTDDSTGQHTATEDEATGVDGMIPGVPGMAVGITGVPAPAGQGPDPSVGSGIDPAAAMGSDPAVAMRTDPSVAVGMDPAVALGSDPAAATGMDPAAQGLVPGARQHGTGSVPLPSPAPEGPVPLPSNGPPSLAQPLPAEAPEPAPLPADASQGKEFSVRTLGQGVPFSQQISEKQNQPAHGSGRRRKLATPPDAERAERPEPPERSERPAGPESPARPHPQPGRPAQHTGHPQQPPHVQPAGQIQIQTPHAPGVQHSHQTQSGLRLPVEREAEGRAYAIGAPDEGAEGPEPLDGPGGAVEVANRPLPQPVDDELPPEPLDNPRRLLVWPAPDVSTQQALSERGYRPVVVHSREEVDAQIAAFPAALFVDPLTGPITRTALQSLRQAAVAAEVPVLVTAGLGQATREAAYGADPAILLKALAPRDSDQHPSRVLLIEEHEEIALALTDALERRGLQVARAGTDTEAVTLAAQMRPNLVVMDLMQVRRRRAGIIDWLRANGQLNRTPLVVYTSAGLNRAELPRLSSGETVLFLAERSTSGEVQARIVDLLAKIGTN